MTKIYYITVQPFNMGKYYLHSGGCPFLQEGDKRVLIGFFGSLDEALEECRKLGIEVKECVFCSGNNKRRYYVTGNEKYIHSDIVEEISECALFSAVN